MIRSNAMVSVIIPCYNAERWIREAINSCLAQTYSPIEIIVVDDGSTDGSLDIIKSYGDKIKYVTGPNRGGSYARNRGFEISHGEFVLFLDSDDLIEPDTISALIKGSCRQYDAIVTCEWHHLIETRSGWKTLAGVGLNSSTHHDNLISWLQGLYIPTCAILWPRHLIEKLGGWDETLTCNQDGDIVIRALIHGVDIVYVKGGQAIYRHYHGHVSVGKTSSKSALKSRIHVLEKAELALAAQGRLSLYKVPIGQAYHNLVSASFAIDNYIALEALKHSKRLAGNQAITGTFIHRILCRTIGIERKEKLVQTLAKFGISRSIRKQNAL